MKKLFTAVFCSFAAFSFAQLHGVGSDWGAEAAIPKFDVTKSQRGVLYNNMCMATTGRIFVLTTESNPSNNIMTGIYTSYSDNGGTTWSAAIPFTPVNLVVGSGAPKITIDNSNNVNLIWSSKVPAAIFFSKLDVNLNVLIDTVRIASKQNYDAFTPHITIDKNGRVHAIWHEGDPQSAQTAESYYSQSTNGGNTWSTPTLLSNNDGKHSAFPRAQFDACSSDTIAVAWRDSVTGQLWDVQMRVSTNAGATWNNVFTVASGSDYDSDPDVVIDGQSRIHIFFHKYPQANLFNGANVRYGYSDNLGATWMPNGFTALSDTSYRSHLIEGSRYDLTNNILWTFWKDERDFFSGQERGDMVCSYSLDRGVTWSTPEFVTDWDTLPVGYKAACVLQNGEVGVNYEVGDQTTGLGTRTVYFRKRSSPLINSVGEFSFGDFVAVYPNPSTGRIFFHTYLTDYELRIFDARGKEMYFEKNMNGNIELNLEKLSRGMCFYRAISGKKEIVQGKIIIQ